MKAEASNEYFSYSRELKTVATLGRPTCACRLLQVTVVKMQDDYGRKDRQVVMTVLGAGRVRYGGVQDGGVGHLPRRQGSTTPGV